MLHISSILEKPREKVHITLQHIETENLTHAIKSQYGAPILVLNLTGAKSLNFNIIFSLAFIRVSLHVSPACLLVIIESKEISNTSYWNILGHEMFPPPIPPIFRSTLLLTYLDSKVWIF